MGDKGDFNFHIPLIGISILLIAFWGEPDLVDALIHYFMKFWIILI